MTHVQFPDILYLLLYGKFSLFDSSVHFFTRHKIVDTQHSNVMLTLHTLWSPHSLTHSRTGKKLSVTFRGGTAKVKLEIDKRNKWSKCVLIWKHWDKRVSVVLLCEKTPLIPPAGLSVLSSSLNAVFSCRSCFRFSDRRWTVELKAFCCFWEHLLSARLLWTDKE